MLSWRRSRESGEERRRRRARIGRPGSRVGERLSRVFDPMTASFGKESKKVHLHFQGCYRECKGLRSVF